MSFGNQGARVWRKTGEKEMPKCLKSSVKYPQSVTVWGAMSAAGVGPLCFIKGRVNAASYQEILEHFMLPSAEMLYGDEDFIFQHDLAPAHSAKTTVSGDRPSPPSSVSGNHPSPPSSVSGDSQSPPSSVSGDRPSPPSSVSGDRPSPPSSVSGDRPSPPSSVSGDRPSPPSSVSGDCPSPPSSVSGDHAAPQSPGGVMSRLKAMKEICCPAITATHTLHTLVHQGELRVLFIRPLLTLGIDLHRIISKKEQVTAQPCPSKHRRIIYGRPYSVAKQEPERITSTMTGPLESIDILAGYQFAGFKRTIMETGTHSSP
ncbi:unnamed protein product, partial [Ranitomeya imitator]